MNSARHTGRKMPGQGARAYARQGGKRLSALLLGASSLLGVAQAQAQTVPVTTAPYSVAQGTIASFDSTGTVQTVTQTSARAVLDWGNLSVAAGSTLQFVQPDRNSITLNRVTGGTASAINGTLTANGQVWVVRRRRSSTTA